MTWLKEMLSSGVGGISSMRFNISLIVFICCLCLIASCIGVIYLSFKGLATVTEISIYAASLGVIITSALYGKYKQKSIELKNQE